MENPDIDIERPRSLTGLFKWLRGFWFAYICSEVLLAVGVVVYLMTGGLENPGEYTIIGDWLMGIGGVLMIAAYIGCIILFSRFSYRAVKNLKIWKVKYIDTSPGWAVGWYFIPIANLFKPYAVMCEIWDGSHRFDDIDKPRPGFMPLWWTGWIVTNIVGNVSMRMSINAGLFETYVTNVPLYETSLKIDVFTSVAGILTALCILSVLQKIMLKQEQRINAETFM